MRRGLSHLRNFLNADEAHVIGAADRIEQWRDGAAKLAADVAKGAANTAKGAVQSATDDSAGGPSGSQ